MCIYVDIYDPSVRPQARFWFVSVYDDKNPGEGITEKAWLRRNHCASNMEEKSLRTWKNPGGALIEREPLRRSHGVEIMEKYGE